MIFHYKLLDYFFFYKPEYYNKYSIRILTVLHHM